MSKFLFFLKIFAILITLTSCSNNKCDIGNLSLEENVKRSQLISVGSVVEVGTNVIDDDYPVISGLFKLNTHLKGNAETLLKGAFKREHISLSFIYDRKNDCPPTKGQSVILFLSVNDNGGIAVNRIINLSNDNLEAVKNIIEQDRNQSPAPVSAPKEPPPEK